VQGDPRPRGTSAQPEQVRGVLRAELAEGIDVLRGDSERGTRGRQDVKVAARRDEVGDQVGGRLDDVLAVVEDEQGRRPVELLCDLGLDVRPLRRSQGSPAHDGVAHSQRRTDLADDVLRSRHPDELDEVDDGLFRCRADDMSQPGLAEPAGPDDRGDPRRAHQRADLVDVVGAAQQLRAGIPNPLSHRVIRVEQLPVDAGEAWSGVDAQTLGEVASVGLVACERGRGPDDGGLAREQRSEHLLVVGVGLDGMGEQVQRLVVLAQCCRGERERASCRPGVEHGGATDVLERPGLRRRRHRQGQSPASQVGGLACRASLETLPGSGRDPPEVQHVHGIR
jgi:hypothetical protein